MINFKLVGETQDRAINRRYFGLSQAESHCCGVNWGLENKQDLFQGCVECFSFPFLL